MRVELSRADIEEAIIEYVKKKVNTTFFTKIEVTQAKSAKATITLSEVVDDDDEISEDAR